MPKIFHDQDLECVWVSIADQVTRCYIIPSMEEGVAHITSDLAEAIKQVYAPTDKRQPNVWFPHQPRHIHCADNTHGAQPARGGHRNWVANLSKLASGTRVRDSERMKRYYLKKKEEARCAAETAQNDTDEPYTTTSETPSLDAPSP